TWSAFPCGGYMTKPSDGRVFLCNDVAPGATYDFQFNVTAPASASGSIRLGVRMVQDGVQWFGGQYAWTLPIPVVDTAPPPPPPRTRPLPRPRPPLGPPAGATGRASRRSGSPGPPPTTSGSRE